MPAKEGPSSEIAVSWAGHPGGSWPHRPSRVDLVAPRGAIGASDLGCQPATFGVSALAVLLLCNPPRRDANTWPFAWRERSLSVGVRDCPGVSVGDR